MLNITTTVNIEHPEDSEKHYSLKAHVIPPHTDWSNVPDYGEMIDDGVEGVLLSLSEFYALVMHEEDEEEITDDTVLSGVICNKCKETLPDHTVADHMDEEHPVHVCPHSYQEEA